MQTVPATAHILAADRDSLDGLAQRRKMTRSALLGSLISAALAGQSGPMLPPVELAHGAPLEPVAP